MRPIFLAGLAGLALILLAAGAQAQGQLLPGPAFTLEALPPKAPVEPGGNFTVALVLERTCPNQATMLDQQQVSLAITASGPVEVSGPAQAEFPQQVCASQPSVTLTLPYDVAVSAQANASSLGFVVKAQPDSLALHGPASEQRAGFIVAVEQPEPVVAAVESEQESPSPAFAALAAVLAAAAATMRRRA